MDKDYRVCGSEERYGDNKDIILCLNSKSQAVNKKLF